MSLLGRILVVVAAFGVAWLASLKPAVAFELTRTVTGQHVRWNVPPNQPINYTIDDGLGDELNLGETHARAVIIAAMKTWEAVQCDLCHDPDGAACPPISCASHALGVQFTDDPQWAPQNPMLGPSCVDPAGEATGIVDGDCPKTGGPWKKQPNGNQVAFLTGDQWVFSQFTIALTLVAANQVSGQIADADILINARDKKFCAENCQSNEYDLASTVTHEAGHLLGLDHSDVQGSTMVLQGQPQQTFMRTLSSDDIAGVCRAYRMAFDPDGCQKSEPGFFDCAATPYSRGKSGVVWLMLLAVVGLCVRRFTSIGGAGVYSRD